MIGLISTSLKVVSIAAVFCASLRRRAMVWRKRVNFTRSSLAPKARGGAATAAAAGAGALFSAAKASPLVTRPSFPVPCTLRTSRPVSAPMRCTLGGATVAATGAGAGVGGGAAGAGAAAFGAAFGARPAPALMRPSTAPMPTVVPTSATISSNTPASGADTSTLTLSVSSSTKVSSLAIASPAFLVQRATVASVTLSPSVGTTISVIALSSNCSGAGPHAADQTRLFTLILRRHLGTLRVPLHVSTSNPTRSMQSPGGQHNARVWP